MLKIENLRVNYGKIVALKGISFEVHEGEIVTLLGANGAGKSTTMNTIMGLLKPVSGSILYKGMDITHAKTREIVQKRLILSPEGRQIFPDFSVADNLMMGAFVRGKKESEETMQVVFNLFPRLKERIRQPAGTLSGGEQQMLAIGRALMGKPELLLLDEPSLGLAPILVADMFEMIQRIRSLGTTILLVEQNARVALKISDRAYVLETGNVVLEGSAEELIHSRSVAEAYLGGT